MKRKIRTKNECSLSADVDYKHEIIKDILYQIDYQAALRQQVVSLNEDVMIDELKKLPTSVLLSWYFAYLFIRRELMCAGYELNGFKVLDVPKDTIHDLISKDPDFDLKQYIF